MCVACLRVYPHLSGLPDSAGEIVALRPLLALLGANRECVSGSAVKSQEDQSKNKKKFRLTSLVIKVDMLLRQGQAEMRREVGDV